MPILKQRYYWNGFATSDNDTNDMRNIFPFLLVFYYLLPVVDHVINKEGSHATNKPKQPAPLAHHHCESSSPALCNRTSTCLMLGELAY